MKLDYLDIAEPNEPRRRGALRFRFKWSLKRVLVGSLCAIGLLLVYKRHNFVGRTVDGSSPAENILLSALDENFAGDWLKEYTSSSHLPGTNPGLVEFTRAKFEEYGLKATVDPYEVYVSYPKDHALKLIDQSGSVIYSASLEEDRIEEDPGSFGASSNPTFFSYAANGNVTSEFVYANYGRRQDFEVLESWGVNITGKIVIARFGKVFRGLKVKFAQEKGAAGVLIYSDPGDDHDLTVANGYKPYPFGPARQNSSVERGSVQFLGAMDAAPGDPTTPGYASKPGAKRVSPHNSTGKIPAIPVSFRDMAPILRKLNGHGHTELPSDWKGAIGGVEYSTGPVSDFSLNLYSMQDYNISTLSNVYGEIEGCNKDEVIVIGNHRDAWASGAADPGLGSAALIEIARALGALKALGHKFKRSIVLQSYDGEEYGLLGSTEQGEYFAKEHKRKVVSYLNIDMAFAGRGLRLRASPLLKQVLYDKLRLVPHPENGTLYDHYVGKGREIGVLGSGSDYTVFLEHLGIPSADFGFAIQRGDSIYHYHSNYDSYAWMNKFGDAGFKYINALSKYVTLVAFTLNDHELIPLGLKDYGIDLSKYFEQVVEQIPPKWWLNRKAKHGAPPSSPESIQFDGESMKYTHKRHSKKHSKDELNVAHLVKRIRKDLKIFKERTLAFDAKAAELQASFDDREHLWWWQRLKLNGIIRGSNKVAQYFERNFLHHGGLYRRAWFKHIVFVSGRFTGYAGQTLPGLREAIEDEDLERFLVWLQILRHTIHGINVGLHPNR